MKDRVMICFATGQSDCNLLPILSSKFQPQKVCLLCTPEMKEEAAFFKEALNGRTEVEIIELETSDEIGRIQDVLMEVVDRYENKVVMNITGGKKTMTIAAFNVCSAFAIPFFYLDLKTFNVFYFENNQSGAVVEPRVENIQYDIKNNKGNLKIFLKARKIVAEDLHEWQPPTDDEKEYFDFIMKFRDPSELQVILEGLRILNKYASKSVKPNNRIEVPIERKDWSHLGFNEICEELEKLEFLLPSGSALIKFKNHETAEFLAGKWFEKYCAMVFKNLFPQLPIFHGEMFITGQTKNEFNLVFLKDSKIFIGEVKASHLSEESPKHSPIIYKLDSLKNSVGGKSSQACLISLDEVNNEIKGRCKTNKIFYIDKILGRVDILEKQIKEWLKK